MINAQISDPEGYGRLSYKTLAGFLWTNAFCGQATYVGKMDDDAFLDLDTLLHQLASKRTDTFISCPTVMRNVRPTRQNRTGSMLGKWYMGREDLPRRVYPDYCPGWLYVTTPKVGLALAEVAAQYADEVLPMAKMDDVFVTGILRERLGMSLTQMAPGLWSRVWDTSLSECPFISMIKLVFFNDIVLEKGNPSHPYINGYKFVGCVLLENALENLEASFPATAYRFSALWRVCARS